MDIFNKLTDILPNKENDANNGVNGTKLLTGGAKVLAAGLALLSPITGLQALASILLFEHADSFFSDYKLAYNEYKKKHYGKALEYLDKCENKKDGKYSCLRGMCHFGLFLSLKENEPGRDIEKEHARNCLSQCVSNKDFIKQTSKDFDVYEVFWLLAQLTEDTAEKRRYYIGSMKSNKYRIQAKREYEDLTSSLLDEWSKGDSKRFIDLSYHERQFVYIAKDTDSMAGNYDDNILWQFTIDHLPMGMNFPLEHHVRPNSLYYAHPAQRGVYLPFEDANDKLFEEKIREFESLCIALGATQFNYRKVMGHQQNEAYSRNADVHFDASVKDEEGNDYKGSADFKADKKRESAETQDKEKWIRCEYDPIEKPSVPDDLCWLPMESKWQALTRNRLQGNQIHYHEHISSKETMKVEDLKMSGVKLAFESFMVNAHLDFTLQMKHAFQRKEDSEIEYEVTFKPLTEYGKENKGNKGWKKFFPFWK